MTFAVVWLVVSPARAMAPLCDPRGATGFAPPPQIQNEELSLDIPADCFAVNPFDAKNYVPGHNVQIETWTPQEPLAFASSFVFGLEFTERLCVRWIEEVQPPLGIRTSIDRPPRA